MARGCSDWPAEVRIYLRCTTIRPKTDVVDAAQSLGIVCTVILGAIRREVAIALNVRLLACDRNPDSNGFSVHSLPRLGGLAQMGPKWAIQ